MVLNHNKVHVLHPLNEHSQLMDDVDNFHENHPRLNNHEGNHLMR
jgi:hypothetical protein